MAESQTDSSRGATALVIIATCLVLAGLSAFCWLCGKMVMLAFAGILVAIFFRSLGVGLSRVTRLPVAIALPVAVVLLAALGVGVAVVLGRLLETQLTQLVQIMPDQVHRLEGMLGRNGYGQWILSHVPTLHPDSMASTVAHQAAGMVSVSVAVITGLVAMLVLGLFLAFQPGVYRGGLIALVPVAHRNRAGQVLDELTIELRWWMIGQGFVMVVIGLMLTLGMVLLHNKLAMALGLLAGLVTFVPYLGAFVATGIALLATMSQGAHVWTCTGILYLVVYLLEGYCITPMVQRGTVELPPALTLVMQLVLGVMFGLPGLVLAAPLLVSFLVLTKMLYLQDLLGDPVTLAGTHEASG